MRPGKINLLLLAVLVLLLSCSNDISKKIGAVNGEIDFSGYDFGAKKPLKLDGEWDFYYGRFLSANDIDSIKKDSVIKVPGLWNDLEINGNKIPGTGYGTYRLKMKSLDRNLLYAFKLLDAATSYRLFVNGTELASNGNPAENESVYSAQFMPQTVPVDLTKCKGDNEGEIDLIIHVANYLHKKGGLWESIYFGSFTRISDMRENSIITSFFIIGIIFIMSLYHFGLFFLRKKDLSTLFFAVLCATIGIRVLVTGERVLVHWIPGINFQLLNKLDYLSAYTNAGLVAVFVYILFKDYIAKKTIKVVIYTGALIGALILVLPLSIYAEIKTFFDLYVLIGGLAVIASLALLAIRKVNGAFIAFAGFFIMYGTGINDVLYQSMVVNTMNMVSFGLFFYILSQSYLLSKLFTNAFSIIENLTEELTKTNSSYSRFVPHQFLSFLGHKNITDVQRGDHVEKEMTVFFSDIRSFTSLSESMTPDENFKFINSYLGRVSPLIRDMHGFIDKFIGDAIMALFPDNPENALKAAINIRHELQEYNRNRAEQGYIPIEIGIALHTGMLMLGTIGETNRMDGTVISDAVNLASRIEGLTKIFGSSIIITEETLSRIENPDSYRYRYLGNIHVKGKNQSVKIYEVFEGDHDASVELKQKTLPLYEQGIKYYYGREYTRALEYFTKVLETNPEDAAASFYVKRTQAYLEKKVTDDIDSISFN